MKYLRIIALLIMSALFSLANIYCCGKCRSGDESHKRDALTVQIDKPFTLQFGQISYMESENLYVELIEITEDSRCPVGVVCAWEGQATALIGFNKGENTKADYSVTSRAGHPDLAKTEFDNYSITLMELLPAKVAGETIQPTDYKIELIISKAD